MQRLVKVDGKVRTDSTYPAGFMGKANNKIRQSELQFTRSNTNIHLYDI